LTLAPQRQKLPLPSVAKRSVPFSTVLVVSWYCVASSTSQHTHIITMHQSLGMLRSQRRQQQQQKQQLVVQEVRVSGVSRSEGDVIAHILQSLGSASSFNDLVRSVT
jgi:predicted nucleic acid-binding protein